MYKRKLALLFVAGLFLIHPFMVDAKDYVIDPKRSKIDGSIRYTVIGKYLATFNEFEGIIRYELPENNNSVELRIHLPSLQSSHPALDKFVLSKRLLGAEEFPSVIFSGKLDKANGEEHSVTGSLTLHGVTERLQFPFVLQGPFRDKDGREYIQASGRWLLKRKDFNIYWHDFFDKGGMLVANHFVVEWQLEAYQVDFSH